MVELSEGKGLKVGMGWWVRGQAHSVVLVHVHLAVRFTNCFHLAGHCRSSKIVKSLFGEVASDLGRCDHVTSTDGPSAKETQDLSCACLFTRMQ